MNSIEFLDEPEDKGYQFPIAYYGLEDDFDPDAVVKWRITSPNGIVTEKEAEAILFSPLDYGIWGIDLLVQNEDGEWDCEISHSFDNPDPSKDDNPVLLDTREESVN